MYSKYIQFLFFQFDNDTINLIMIIVIKLFQWYIKEDTVKLYFNNYLHK